MSAVHLVCGVDEAGRGPLAGPVYAAAVILNREDAIAGLADSKKLSARRRDTLADEIRRRAIAWAVASASVEEIDTLNILQASLLAMQRAVAGLSPAPQEALVDGLHSPVLPCAVRAIVRGDSTVPAISAASILAKVTRDSAMLDLHRRYPQYHFDRHKGYPTQLHLDALQVHGISAAHRCSYAPVARLLKFKKDI